MKFALKILDTANMLKKIDRSNMNSLVLAG
jgi:hypothetical protein